MADRNLCRLRDGAKIIGYSKTTVTGATVYSRDAYWWTGGSLEAPEADRSVGFPDINRQPLFEQDIVQWAPDPRKKEYKKGVLLRRPDDGQFVMKDIESGEVQPVYIGNMPLFGMDELRLVSHSFLNPDMEERFRLDD